MHARMHAQTLVKLVHWTRSGPLRLSSHTQSRLFGNNQKSSARFRRFE
jgi:hypothetical protein